MAIFLCQARFCISRIICILNFHIFARCVQLQSDLLGISPDATGDAESTRAFKPAASKVSSAIDALHHALAERGTDSLVQLGKKFHVMDNDGAKGLSYEEVS
jgi:hypothetical protein